MLRKFIPLIPSLLLLVISCNHGSFVPVRQTILLNGTWHFALDTARIGTAEKWYSLMLSDSVKLPGTLDENRKGIPNNNRGETSRLSRELMYEGMAWYQKDVNIPESWKGQNIRLIMERTKPTHVWIDTVLIGSNNNILTPQYYDLSNMVTPGKHILTIMVDNGNGSVPQGITKSHAWTEHTQSNWNGIIGKFLLEASNTTRIKTVQVYPDIDTRNVNIKIMICSNEANTEKMELLLQANSRNTGKKHNLPVKKYTVTVKTGENIINLTYNMGKKSRLWSEFEPAFYKLKVALKSKKVFDNTTIDFGMRKFSVKGTQFAINDTRTFLRGKNDACVFPLTGYPPMDVEGWQQVFRIAKSYQINFFRFHSWTPPLAAFEAADIEGIYLQPELPFWGGFSKDQNNDLNAFLLNEGENILEAYGNHPSFVMFALGNELSGDFDVMKDMLKHFKSLDSRHLMSYGSNNYLGYRGQAEGEDYYVGCRIGADTDATYSTHIRGSFSFKNADDGGYINGCYPSSNLNYSGAISKCTVPVISHEVGQYQVYPNYDEILKYTGVMKPWNFEIFRDRIREKNMGDQAGNFFRASGALSAICYKADIEMAIRTPGFGGFHLLDLQDFPGQGTALVGMLDAFMDSKGIIAAEEFSQFCNSVVPLVIMEKYCWTNNEPFTGKIQVANYSGMALKSQPVKWVLLKTSGEVIASDEITVDISQGELTDIADLNIDLSQITLANKLSLNICLEGTKFKNSYPLWVYPANTDTKVKENIFVARKLDKNTLLKLTGGAAILLFPEFEDINNLTVGGLFTTDYWNYTMFKRSSERSNRPVSPGTMGILTKPDHPLFDDFPTEFHTNWQWWSIVKNSRPFILDNTPKGYRPLVQVIDNIDRNHKLGLIFEFAVGKGKLLVCMSDLMVIQDRPEGRQLYSSILKYMASDKFNPEQSLTLNELIELFGNRVSAEEISGAGSVSQ